MATCPNKNLNEWKSLVIARGEDVAFYLWDKYDGNVPESESRTEIVKSGLKATNILQSPKANQFFNTAVKNKITGESFWNKMQAYIIFWYRCYIPLTHYKWNIDWEAGRG